MSLYSYESRRRKKKKMLEEGEYKRKREKYVK